MASAARSPSIRTLSIERQDRPALEMDVYEASSATAPIIVYLHGGAWVSGSRLDYADRLVALARHDITVVSLDYRLATEAPWPAQREDALDAAREARRLFGDRPTILAGASAGAHLAALSAFTTEDFDGMIGYFGRYDLTSRGELIVPASGLTVPEEIVAAVADGANNTLDHENRLSLLAGVSADELSEDALAALSPLSQITPDAPPLLLMHGTEDALVHHAHTEGLVARAAALGVECTLVLVPGANHEDPAFASTGVTETVAAFAHRIARSAPRADRLNRRERELP